MLILPILIGNLGIYLLGATNGTPDVSDLISVFETSLNVHSNEKSQIKAKDKTYYYHDYRPVHGNPVLNRSVTSGKVEEID